MSLMFYECSSLITIDLTNFNINNVKDVANMFRYCKNLKKINIKIKDKKSLKIISKLL